MIQKENQFFHWPIQLTSNIDYSLSKKRFLMMVRKTNRVKSTTLKISLLPVLIVLSTTFANYVSSSPTVTPEFTIQNQDSSQSAPPASPYLEKYLPVFDDYQSSVQEYSTGNTSARNVLISRAEVNFFHKRLHPEEQQFYSVPDLPDGLLDHIVLTEEEQNFQDRLIKYNALFESYRELPTDREDPLYKDPTHPLNKAYKDLEGWYNVLDQASRIFVVDNIPPSPNRIGFFVKSEEGKLVNLFQVSLSDRREVLPIHFVGPKGEIVATTTDSLTDDQIQYLINNTRKSDIVQVYPLPEEKNPTESEMNTWLDTYYYAVWLDGDRIDNEKLKNIAPESIHHFKVVEVPWNGNRRKPFDYSVMLYTYPYYELREENYRPNKSMIPFYNSILTK